MRKLFIATAAICFQVIAFAVEHGVEHGGGHGESEIPYSTIGFQALNLGILLVVLFFASRKAVVELFKTRYMNYNDQAQKTEEASKAAELALSDIKSRIQNLQNSEAASIEAAKTDAVILKNKIIQEAKAQAEKIKIDTQLIVTAEINSAKDEIRKEIINASIDMAKSNIKGSAENITYKSENSFLTNIAKTKNQVIS